MIMKCPQCKSENTDGKNFCSDCGSLLTPQLLPLIKSQVAEHIREHFKDRTVVDVETTEAIAERFLKWGKWFLIPATLLITLLGFTLGIIGIRDVSDVHKAAQQAISESDDATKKAEEATAKAQEAEGKATEAINAIGEATKKMGRQMTGAQVLSDKVSGLEKKTANQFAEARQHVEARLTELDERVEEANKNIVQQQSKLVSTNELVTAMFSKGQVEYFAGNTTNSIVVPVPAANGDQRGAVVLMLLKGAPIFQTIQLNFHIYVQPKSSYFVRANLLTFFWADPAENLKQFPLEVSYVPDPTYKGTVYSKLSVRNGHVFADDEQIQ